jgi:hypothetical protein
MFSINLKLEAYWSFLLIFDTVSHKTNESGQKGMQNKTDGQKKSLIFLSGQKRSASFFMAKKEFPHVQSHQYSTLAFFCRDQHANLNTK